MTLSTLPPVPTDEDFQKLARSTAARSRGRHAYDYLADADDPRKNWSAHDWVIAALRIAYEAGAANALEDSNNELRKVESALSTYTPDSGLKAGARVVELNSWLGRALRERDENGKALASVLDRVRDEAAAFIHFDAYALAASRTASNDNKLAVFALGLAGEVGEVIELVKKHLGHAQPLDADKVRKELGDVLWYAANLSLLLGIRFSDVARLNIEKLKARYPQGFSPAASVAKADESPLVAAARASVEKPDKVAVVEAMDNPRHHPNNCFLCGTPKALGCAHWTGKL